MSEYGQAVALAIFSLVLPVGWSWLKGKWVKVGTKQVINEPWVNALARFFYFVGLPYLAVIFGVLPPRFLGLKGLENFVSTHLSGDFSAGLQKAVTVMLVEGLVDASVMMGIGLVALLILAGIRLGLAQMGLELGAGYHASVLTTVYDSLHWAFYRAIFWLVTADLYLAIVWSIAWLLLEWGLVAWVQKNWPAQQPHFLTNTIILILTSTLFFYSPNLWLLWLIHLALVALVTLRFRSEEYLTVTD
jgi:hypothetical protein